MAQTLRLTKKPRLFIYQLLVDVKHFLALLFAAGMWYSTFFWWLGLFVNFYSPGQLNLRTTKKFNQCIEEALIFLLKFCSKGHFQRNKIQDLDSFTIWRFYESFDLYPWSQVYKWGRFSTTQTKTFQCITHFVWVAISIFCIELFRKTTAINLFWSKFKNMDSC